MFEDFKAPLDLPQIQVQPDWIDYNNHMNAAFFLVAFDKGVDALLDIIGVTRSYIEKQQASTFTLELHTTYLRELRLGDPIRITCQILDFDDKRVHYFFRMYHATENYLSATCEQILMHMDMRSRNSTPFPREILERLTLVSKAHNKLPWPDQAGNVISIRRA
jgi:acyl-CoA thioester hydrolase